MTSQAVAGHSALHKFQVPTAVQPLPATSQ
ncbi:hypothetical protein PDIG_27430 [Penicillium digitatum PHI26]|uniref:Uncharacterized protein n=2 Tax=Penicillium digitatum TaxID=36651 RepID=K9G056_PEND2|nr:hypothetical protein PDIP_61870 [Penicillium digitatum Pd1]EKV10049.1 hypothetical protein PDIP_61870 [Penicillium digitatum Pd1]EKV15305.1 hypothetical protein PDIG_27430 [Penicillium digitatum PHI26]